MVVAVAMAVAPCTAWGEETWRAARSEHFLVVGDASARQCRTIARELEQVRTAFESLLGLRVEAGKPLLILAAGSERTMRRLLPWYWQRRKAARPAGVFITGAEKHWAVVRADRQENSILFHEYTHLLGHLGQGALPRWLAEGLAEFYGGADVGETSVRIGAVSADHIHLLRRGMLLPIAELVAIDYGSDLFADRHRARLFYAEAATLTHYLLLGDDGEHRPRLKQYLHLLEAGLTDAEAVERAFGGALTLQNELRAYIHRLQFPLLAIDARVAEASVEERALRPAEAAAFEADFLLHTGQLREAGRRVDEALRLEPALGFAHLQRGLVLHREGRHAEATRAFAQARSLARGDALTHYRFGTLGVPPEADGCTREEALREAMRVSSAFAPARGALARLLLAEDRSLEEARDLAATAIRLDPSSVVDRATLLELEMRLGRLEGATRAEGDLLRVVRTQPSALGLLVEHYRETGDRPAGEALLRRVVAQNGRNVFAVQSLAQFLEREGRPDEADSILREGLRAEPRSTLLLNQLAWLNAERGVKLEEALALAEQALELAPDAPHILDTKAWALFRLGRLGAAETFARKSLDEGEDPEVREHLGDILAQAGRRAEAVEAWRRALENGNLDPERRRALEAKIAGAAPGATASVSGPS